MSRFKPASEEELAARGIKPAKVRARNENEAWEEKPAKKRGRPSKKKE